VGIILGFVILGMTVSFGSREITRGCSLKVTCAGSRPPTCLRDDPNTCFAAFAVRPIPRRRFQHFRREERSRKNEELAVTPPRQLASGSVLSLATPYRYVVP
jgi:hypothetical protein